MNCHKCIHHGTLSGDAHLCCWHPKSGLQGADPLAALVGTFFGKRGGRVVGEDGMQALGIRLDARGVRHGWANWPFNFDPVWVEACEGYEEKPEA